MRKRFCKLCSLILSLAASFVVAQAQGGPVLSTVPNVTTQGDRIVDKIAPSVALVLTGKGAGRLETMGSAVVVRADGVLLTAYHIIKDAREVQVRLKNGETYDRVELIAFDERRDVAALRVPATNLPALPVAAPEQVKVGDAVYTVSNPKGLFWSASEGILSGVRLSDEVQGAGSGYRLLQFTAPVSHGSSGGLLVDAQGRALGIVVSSTSGQNLNFAVPVSSVMGLAEANPTQRAMLGSGSELRLPVQEPPPPTASSILSADPAELLRAARTVYISSSTSFFEPIQLQNELRKRDEFTTWRMIILDGYDTIKLADIIIDVDKPMFTWTYTFSIKHQKTGILLSTGKLTAWDGNAAAPELAKEIIKRFKEVKPLPAVEKKEKKEKKSEE